SSRPALMSRLIIQHPALSEAAVAAFETSVGAAPASRGPQIAAWDEVPLAREDVVRLAETVGVDAALVRASTSLGDFRLAAFDMDSTLITIECVDEIADYIGKKAEVAAITEAAMRGEITDYDESLRRRV